MISREASENTNQGNFLTANIISSLYESNIVCFDLIDETSSISKWPTGQYEVPASMYGCPEITWTMRYINLTLPSDDIFWTSTGISFDYIKIPDKGIYNHSRDMHILGPYSTSSFQLTFVAEMIQTPICPGQSETTVCLVLVMNVQMVSRIKRLKYIELKNPQE